MVVFIFSNYSLIKSFLLHLLLVIHLVVYINQNRINKLQKIKLDNIKEDIIKVDSLKGLTQSTYIVFTSFLVYIFKKLFIIYYSPYITEYKIFSPKERVGDKIISVIQIVFALCNCCGFELYVFHKNIYGSGIIMI